MQQRPNPLAPSSARPSFVAVRQLMTSREPASNTGMNYYDLLRRSAAGEIPRVKWGDRERNVRFTKADLDRSLASLPLAEGWVRAKPGRRVAVNGDGPDNADKAAAPV